jgi:hypothetical protein
MSDRALRAALIRLAHNNPNLRAELLPLLKEAANFPPDSIGKDVPGAKGEPGSDAGKPWAKGHFTQEKFRELDEKQEDHELDDGKADPSKTAAEFADGHGSEINADANPASKDQNKADHWNSLAPRGVQASEQHLRKSLIRLAHAHPEFKDRLLPLIKGE